MSSSPPGWQPDPRGRHQYRYWDGTQWTDHVADNGQMSTDPVADAGPAATEVQPAVSATPEPAAAAAAEPAAAEPEPAAAAAEPAPAAAAGSSGSESSGEGSAPFTSSAPPGGAASGGGGGAAAADTAKAQAQAVLDAKSPDLATLLSVVAPGSGHLYLGVEPAKRNLAFGLLGATVVAIVLAYFSFILFVIGFVVWAGAAFFAVKDLSGGDIHKAESTSIPQQFVGILLLAGGALLLVSLFLPWYRISGEVSFGGVSGGGSNTINGLKALDVIDLVLIVAGVAAVVGGLGNMGIGVDKDKLPPWLPTAVALLGAVAFVLVVFRMFVDAFPGVPSGIEADIDIGRAPGILLAASASIVLVMANLSTLKGLRK